MTEQLSMFDSGRAKEARDGAMSRVDQHADESWKDAAYRIITQLARERDYFTTDDVLKRLELLDVETHELRALGPVMRHMARQGVIEPKGYTASSRVVSHARPKRLWRSLLV